MDSTKADACSAAYCTFEATGTYTGVGGFKGYFKSESVNGNKLFLQE
jgi:hypothetical protein